MKNRTVFGKLASLGFGLVASGCTALAPSESGLPSGAVLVPTSATYRSWYAQTESCSGLSGKLENVQFYVVPGVETFQTADGMKVGEWIREGDSNRIIVAGNYENHEMVVRHELLHSLLKQAGHPSEYFVTKCQLTWDSWGTNIGD